MIKTKIEWADSTWSPISGCRYGCEYCYARAIANRFKGCDQAEAGENDEPIVYLKNRLQQTSHNGKARYAPYPFGFTPTFHEYRLGDLEKKKFGKTIFVGSTADIFGDWVPDEWIIKVFDACKKVAVHRYLFLTKNPSRYIRLHHEGLLPDGEEFWYGTTATDENKPIFFSDIHHTFVSFEPMLGPFASRNNPEELASVDWFVLGAETGTRKNKVIPKREWVEAVVEYAETHQKPVFMKDSLKLIWGESLITEFPWGT